MYEVSSVAPMKSSVSVEVKQGFICWYEEGVRSKGDE